MAFSDGIGDFRSDTVTRPTADMLAAMARAEVGDDVYSEDPTVNLLQEEAAALLGKEAGLFTPTGSMGNQLGINLLTEPGDEVLCVERAHVRNHEKGAGAAISGVQFRTVPAQDGRITPADVHRVVEESGYHLPQVSLLAWENTHNVSGGTVVDVELMRETTAAARAHGLAVHLDGARLFNASEASGVAPAGYAELADTVQFCFSKGLGAPIGSMICGPADLIAEARTLRKRLGGGMRQVGVLAAAARVALARRDQLAADHETATRLAHGLDARYPGSVDLTSVQTNMVIVDATRLPVPGGAQAGDTEPVWKPLVGALADGGIRVGGLTRTLLRFVTHHQVDGNDVDRVLGVLDALSADAPTAGMSG